MLHSRVNYAGRSLLGAFICIGLLVACVGQKNNSNTSGEADQRFVDLQILAINDFHGSLEPGPGDLGGAAYLATHLLAAEASVRHSITVSAGDLVGASPLFSSLFHDEPSVEAANIWGLDYHAMGNHELDEGLSELIRLQRGGSHPEDGDADGDGFAGADFEILAANLFADEQNPLPGYAVQVFDGIPVAIIGATLSDTLSIVTSEAGRGLVMQEDAVAINRLVSKLQKEAGIEAFIVLMHQGGMQSSRDFDACEDFSGDILDVVEKVSPAVDLFVTAHTHRYYLCEVAGRPVTSAWSNGRLYTRIQMQLDRSTGDMRLLAFDNVPVTRDVPANGDITALLQKYRQFVKPLADRPVGTISARFGVEPEANGESAMGQLICDAQLEATKNQQAVIAFMNPYGIRAELKFAEHGAEPGIVRFGDIFASQPFNNTLVSMTLTGRQIHTLLEDQWQTSHTIILAVSEGFTYTWDSQAANGDKVDPQSIKLHGVLLEPAVKYRITVNNFIAGGGDSFVVLREGTDVVWSVGDVAALENYLALHSPLSPASKDRIKRI